MDSCHPASWYRNPQNSPVKLPVIWKIHIATWNPGLHAGVFVWNKQIIPNPPFQSPKDRSSPTSDRETVVEKNIHLSADHARYLNCLAQVKALSEDQLIEKALDILFSLADLLDSQVERQVWSFLSEASLQRIWDNAEDAVYDNWKELYALPLRLALNL